MVLQTIAITGGNDDDEVKSKVTVKVDDVIPDKDDEDEEIMDDIN